MTPVTPTAIDYNRIKVYYLRKSRYGFHPHTEGKYLMKKGIRAYRRYRPVIDTSVTAAAIGATLVVRCVNLFADRNAAKVGSTSYTAKRRVINLLEGASLVIALVQQTEKLKLWRRSPGFIPRAEAVIIPEHVARVAGGSSALAVAVHQLSGDRLSPVGKLPAAAVAIGAIHVITASSIELMLRRDAVARQADMAADIAVVWGKSLLSRLGFTQAHSIDPGMLRSLISTVRRAGRETFEDEVDVELQELLSRKLQ